MSLKNGTPSMIKPAQSIHNVYQCIHYNSVYTKLKTNLKKHTTVPRRQYTVCIEEALKCKNPSILNIKKIKNFNIMEWLKHN